MNQNFNMWIPQFQSFHMSVQWTSVKFWLWISSLNFVFSFPNPMKITAAPQVGEIEINAQWTEGWKFRLPQKLLSSRSRTNGVISIVGALSPRFHDWYKILDIQLNIGRHLCTQLLVKLSNCEFLQLFDTKKCQQLSRNFNFSSFWSLPISTWSSTRKWSCLYKMCTRACGPRRSTPKNLH